MNDAGELTIPEDGDPAEICFDGGGLVSFLSAGAVLFASLAIGSSASLLLIGSNHLIAAMLYGFLALGLASFVAAVALALALAVRRRGG